MFLTVGSVTNHIALASFQTADHNPNGLRHAAPKLDQKAIHAQLQSDQHTLCQNILGLFRMRDQANRHALQPSLVTHCRGIGHLKPRLAPNSCRYQTRYATG
jgi:hypothetical protein